METIFKRWWLLLLNGILFLILGVISLAYPVTALFSVAVYIGVVALVAGIGSIVVALSNMRVRSWGWRLLEGVIDVIFGLLMLGNPLLSAAMIPVLIGIWVFVRGLMYVADSLAWRRRGSGDWSRYLIVGILLLVVLAVTTHTFQIPCSHFFTGNFARSATIGIYISKTRITSEA